VIRAAAFLALLLLVAATGVAQTTTTLAPRQCLQVCAASAGDPPPPPPPPPPPLPPPTPPPPPPDTGCQPEGRHVNVGNVDNLATVTVGGLSSFHLTTPYTIDFSATVPRAITAVQDSSYRFDGGVQWSLNCGAWQGGSVAYNIRLKGPGTYRLKVRKHNALTERGQHIQFKPLTAWALF
jgi:hypothetical protein